MPAIMLHAYSILHIALHHHEPPMQASLELHHVHALSLLGNAFCKLLHA